MRPISWVSWVVVAGSAVVVLAGRAPCLAGAATFDFRVDRFELEVANRLVPDFVEEFDDPILGQWFTQYGTAFAADGFLHLTSPGTEVPDGLGVLPGTTLDLSVVGSARQVFVRDGAFVARSYWEPDELAPGDFNHMSLATLGGGLGRVEVAGLAIMNRTQSGEPVTYTIVQHLVRLGTGDPATPELATVTIEPSAITGQIVFELRFDDGTKTLATAFSLDGGVTFERPFVPVPIFDRNWYGYFLLGADPQTNTVRTSTPAPPLCANGRLIGDVEVASDPRAAGTISITGSIVKVVPAPGLSLASVPLHRRDYAPRRAGAGIRIIDRSLPDMPILDLRSAALRGGPGCGSRDGWRRVRGAFVYRNETNALPPGCIPGSAGGLTRLRLKSKPSVRLKNKTVGRRGLAFEVDLATPWRPAPGERVATTIFLGDASVAALCGTLEAQCFVSGPSVRCE